MTLNDDEISAIMDASHGNLNDAQCRALAFFMMGYMRHGQSAEDARQALFNQVRCMLSTGRPLSVWGEHDDR